VNKYSCAEDLIDKDHRKETLKFGDVIWRRVDPVSNASITVGNGVESQMAGHSDNQGRQGTAGDP